MGAHCTVEHWLERTPGDANMMGPSSSPATVTAFINFENMSFIHSGYFYSAYSSALLLRGAPDTAWILCRSFTPKRHRQLRVSEGLVQGPYVAARAGFEPTTLRTKGAESTNEPHAPNTVTSDFRRYCVQRGDVMSVPYTKAPLPLFVNTE